MTGLAGAPAPAGLATTRPAAAGPAMPSGPLTAQLIDALAGLALALAGA